MLNPGKTRLKLSEYNEYLDRNPYALLFHQAPRIPEDRLATRLFDPLWGAYNSEDSWDEYIADYKKKDREPPLEAFIFQPSLAAPAPKSSASAMPKPR